MIVKVQIRHATHPPGWTSDLPRSPKVTKGRGPPDVPHPERSALVNASDLVARPTRTASYGLRKVIGLRECGNAPVGVRPFIQIAIAAGSLSKNEHMPSSHGLAVVGFTQPVHASCIQEGCQENSALCKACQLSRCAGPEVGTLRHANYTLEYHL